MQSSNCSFFRLLFLSVLLGVSLLLPNTGNTADSPAPQWAKKAYQALQRYQSLSDYWVSHAAPDDLDYFDVEGGWNDDVELAQSLFGYWLLTGDEPLRIMLIDMANKNRQARYTGKPGPSPWFKPGDTRFAQGYHMQEVDVHHSSEEVTLLYPRLFLLDYGNPIPIELMTRSIWNFQDDIPGEENWGQRVSSGILMRSPKFNARHVDWTWPDRLGGSFLPQDVAQNFRATASSLSIAWYYDGDHYLWRDGNQGFIKDHHDAWTTAAISEHEKKPALIPPSKILLQDLSFGGVGGWRYNNDLGGSGWAQDGSSTFRHFYHALIADWTMFNNDADPARKRLALDAKRIVNHAYALRQQRKGIAGDAVYMDRVFMQWRAEYIDDSHDTDLLTHASKNATTRMTAYAAEISKDKLDAAKLQATLGFSTLNDFLREKIDYGKWTDRLAPTETPCPWEHSCLTDQVKFTGSDAFVMASLGGSGIYDGAYPTLYFSWRDTESDIVSLVTKRSSTRLRFWAWNFGKDEHAALQLWRLQSGHGRIRIGTDKNRDGEFDKSVTETPLHNIEKGLVTPIAIKPNQLVLVEIEVTDPKQRNLGAIPDLAISADDLKQRGTSLSLTVHNIGLVSSQRTRVRLLDRSDNPIGADQFVQLTRFEGLTPSVAVVEWTLSSDARPGKILIDPENEWPEITKLNNQLVF